MMIDCEKPGCVCPYSWWTCSNCGAHCCEKHQTFVHAFVCSCWCCEANSLQRWFAKLLEWLQGEEKGKR